MTVVAGSHVKRKRRSVEEKRRIVEETLKPGASVARVAQRHAINANQIFAWRKRYREGQLGSRAAAKLLPVAITNEAEAEKVGVPAPPVPLGIIEMVLPKGKLRIEGRVELSTKATGVRLFVDRQIRCWVQDLAPRRWCLARWLRRRRLRASRTSFVDERCEPRNLQCGYGKLLLEAVIERVSQFLSCFFYVIFGVVFL